MSTEARMLRAELHDLACTPGQREALAEFVSRCLDYCQPPRPAIHEHKMASLPNWSSGYRTAVDEYELRRGELGL